MLYKNEAVLKKAKASDAWAFYQAKSSKGHLTELARDLAGDDTRKAAYTDQIARYEHEKQEIKSQAELLDKESEVAAMNYCIRIIARHRQ